MKYLLDTCVISELVARQPDAGLVKWIDGADEERLYLCAITVGEIAKGIAKLADSERRRALTEWLEEDLLIRFQGRILPIDAHVMLAWGELVASLEMQGRKMPAMDALIAAIALQGNLDLVTRNEGDFVHSGVRAINPWKE
jgi:predicted nucleic acid-binding protein